MRCVPHGDTSAAWKRLVAREPFPTSPTMTMVRWPFHKILLAGCLTVGFRAGGSFERTGETGIVVDRLTPGHQCADDRDRIVDALIKAMIAAISEPLRWRNRAFSDIFEVTRFPSQIESGDQQAAVWLLPIVFDERRKLAAAKLAFPARRAHPRSAAYSVGRNRAACFTLMTLILSE
jgi:hypothetical protein